jgi:hypothetical protein
VVPVEAPEELPVLAVLPVELEALLELLDEEPFLPPHAVRTSASAVTKPHRFIR